MLIDTQPEPTVMVIFGASGDLTWRKLVPALYNLFLDRCLPERFAVVGLDRNFATHLAFASADFTDPAACNALAGQLAAQESPEYRSASHLLPGSAARDDGDRHPALGQCPALAQSVIRVYPDLGRFRL